MFKTALISIFMLASQALFAQAKKETIVIQTPTFCNHCKICETCGQKLETDLYYVKGIKSVTYNEDAQTTTIVYKTKSITPDEIRRAIAKLGFEADGLAADPKAFAERDDCCKPQ